MLEILLCYGQNKAGEEGRLCAEVGLQLLLGGQGRPHSDANVYAKILENHTSSVKETPLNAKKS